MKRASETTASIRRATDLRAEPPGRRLNHRCCIPDDRHWTRERRINALLRTSAMSRSASETVALRLVAEVGQPTPVPPTPGGLALSLRFPGVAELEFAGRFGA